MAEHSQSRRMPSPAAERGVSRQQSTFESACASVLGLSLVAAAVTEGERHVLRYANPALLELAAKANDPGLGRTLDEHFPALAGLEARVLLEQVYRTGQAASSTQQQPYMHERRGARFITMTAWPYRRPGLPVMTLIQYQDAQRPATQRRDEIALDLRAVNERLLVSGLREQEVAEETARRLVVAEEAAVRSETALQSNAAQTQSLARRLMSAQEAERTRLARELHDDVNQQLAGLSIALSALRRDLPESLGAARSEIGQLQQRTIAVIETIRALSHKLHPGSLRRAGLLPALRQLCAETEQYDGRVEFSVTGALNTLPDDVALTLYRVAQEALHNVVRHARASHTKVVLMRDDHHILLQITDDGRGFVESNEDQGLGLLSMEERVLVVNGELRIDSIPGLGTRIWVSIPIEPDAA